MEQYEYRNGPPAPRMVAELAMRHDALVKQLAAAQATIAALEQRVKELKQWVQDQSTANLETMRHMDEMQSRAMDAESQLTQRTAELEAIEKILDIDSGKTTVEKVRDLHHSFEQVWESYQDASNEMFKAQAELERVRGERDEDNKIGLPVIVELLRQANKGQDGPLSVLKGIIAERDELRTLILALPKVEGEIRVEGNKVISVDPIRGADPPLWWRRTIATFEDGLLAKHYSNALQHRQGME